MNTDFSLTSDAKDPRGSAISVALPRRPDHPGIWRLAGSISIACYFCGFSLVESCFFLCLVMLVK